MELCVHLCFGFWLWIGPLLAILKTFLNGMTAPAGILYCREEFVRKSRPAEHQGSSESPCKYKTKRL